MRARALTFHVFGSCATLNVIDVGAPHACAVLCGTCAAVCVHHGSLLFLQTCAPRRSQPLRGFGKVFAAVDSEQFWKLRALVESAELAQHSFGFVLCMLINRASVAEHARGGFA